VTRARQKAERRGRWAETWAALYLMAAGYQIVARRARTPFGEVDIAARKGAVLVIVEVKARRHADQALHAVAPRNQRRIAQAGLALAQTLRCTHFPQRYDLIIVHKGVWLRHVRDAWRMHG
jgi:putative endonuclease